MVSEKVLDLFCVAVEFLILNWLVCEYETFLYETAQPSNFQLDRGTRYVSKAGKHAPTKQQLLTTRYAPAHCCAAA